MSAASRLPAPWPVEVVGVGDEDDPQLESDPRVGLTADPGEISVRLLRSRAGVTLGSTLTRQPDVVDRIRQIPGIGSIRTSRIAGTVGPGGEHWLGFLAAARLPRPVPRPMDALNQSLRAFLERRLEPYGVRLEMGRVNGAWCPGFSDIALSGRKLAGLGLRLAGGWGLVRGVVAVSPPGPEEFQRLDQCHRTFGPGLDYATFTSLSEIPGLSGIDQEAAVQLLGAVAGAPAKMSR
ncbi:MAG: hypothetical protein WA695_02320 [Candidatus Dormiibacterota bacterium]